MTKREQEIYDGVVKILKEYLNPSKIILFGSRAKGTAEFSSDFDFAVECEEIDFSIERKMKDKIEDVCGLYKIDVVYLNKADEDFKNIIF
ncbi:MAG: nucleotidyltransferase domain-containing protein, partial [Candidatus Omnitrophica bacterium]|nr:nucleotidyltransferase domain-containing protein [Candidatus Omnitrophota bacterium]